MYIKANRFDYGKLLKGIVTHLDLQDTPLDDQMVTNVFKGFEVAYKQHRSNQKLEDWEEKIVIEFLSSVQMTCDYLDKDFGEYLDKILQNLVDMLTGDDDGLLWSYIEAFMDRVECDHIPDLTLTLTGDFVVKDDITMTPDVFAGFLRGWVESHFSHSMEGINGFLFDAINENILPHEYMKDITIMDIPGTKVKHGDTLITLPFILLEVYDR